MLKHIFLFLLFFPPHWWFEIYPIWDWESTLFKAFWASLDLSCNRQRATRRDWVRWKGQCLWFQPLHLPVSLVCLWEMASGGCNTERQNANQTNNPFPRFAYRERDLFMKHILFSFRGKSCNHCKGKSMESALFCIKISLLYDFMWLRCSGRGSLGLSISPKEGGI